MSKRPWPLTLGLVLTGILAAAAETFAQVPPLQRVADPAPVPAARPVDDDVQDLLFFSEARPVFIRLHLRVNGRPFRAPWDEYTQKVYAFLDVNGDGTLSKEEAERAPSGDFLRNHLEGAIGYYRDGGSNAKMAELDADKDGKVTKAELTAYYRRFGFDALRLDQGGDRGGSDRLTDALFRHLAKDAADKLTREQLAAAVAVLGKLDFDEDEILTPLELSPPVSRGLYAPLVVDSPYGARQQAPESAFLLVGPEDAGDVRDQLHRAVSAAASGVPPKAPPSRVRQQLLNRYDKDKDGKLTVAEIGLDRATFDALDGDADGSLGAGELDRFLDRSADVDLTAHLGGRPRQPARPKLAPAGTLVPFIQMAAMLLPERTVEVHNPAGRAMPLADALGKTEDGALKLTLAGSQTEIHRTAGRASNADGIKQFYLQQFQFADTDKKRILERKRVEKSEYLGFFFRLADRDGDDKLTEKELTDFLDLHGKGGASQTVLTVSELGRGLFELLDADRDARLSVRELRTAWERLAPYDRGGAVAKADVPRQYQVTVSLGRSFRVRFSANPAGSTPRPAERGPLWFRKMDRNGDGDVSPREFLGTAEEFRRLDLDGDGLVSADEAERFEAGLNGQAKGR
jgi:Ca2+-binding EF-hand superfamily protein